VAKTLELENRNRDVARLRALGLYTNKRIALALGIDETTVSHIYHERSRVPCIIAMSFAEAALMEDVNIEVIRSLTAEHHLETIYSSKGFGRDIHSIVINTAVKMTDVSGMGKEWVSISDAAEIAGMERPRGMYNRVLKGQVVSIKSLEGQAFHIGEQSGLKIAVKKDSIEPAKGKSIRLPGRIELPPKVKQPEFTMVVIRPGDKKPIIIASESLNVTITLSHPEEGWTHEVLKLDVELLPGTRPQIRTRSYAR